jgi:hypothetical protein
MKKRPLPVTAVSWLLIAAGVVGLAYHLREFRTLHPFPYDALWINLVRVLAVLFGAYMLRGHNWARWLAMAWISFHVVLSALHSLGEFAMHAVIFALFAYALFQRDAAEYFRAAKQQAE